MKRTVIWHVALTAAMCVIINVFGVMTVLAEEREPQKEPYEFAGRGTQYDPYLISSYEDIMELREIVDSGNNVDGKYFRQTADIVFPDGEVWNPVGDLEMGYTFAGFYDGNGHTLSNIYCEDPYAGVFSFLAGEVRNLGIESGSFHGGCAGSITSHGTEAARIINCYNKADVYGEFRAGGITDNYSGRIMFCWNFGNVAGTGEGTVTAGITSYGSADIRYCYAVDADKLTDENTFTGKMSASQIIAREDIADYMEQSYRDLFTVYSEAEPLKEGKLGMIARENTVFMICKEDSVFFAGDYEPEVFLLEKEEKKTDFLKTLESAYSFEGEGTEDFPFLISDYEDLEHLRDCVDIGINYEGYYFEQTEDICFPKDEIWNPIGDLRASLPFKGCYDGRGHCLYDVYCVDNYAGIFSYLNGEVRNLGIESGCFRGDTIGSIASHGGDKARIINCYNKADVTGKFRAGGLVDNYPGEILFSWNLGTVSGETEDTKLAGICVYGSAEIRHCYTKGITDLVNTENFYGSIYESGRVKDTDIGEKLKRNESAYENYIEDGLLDDFVFLQVSEQKGLFFDTSYAPGKLETALLEYIPFIFLLLMIIVLGTGTAAVYYGYHKKHRKRSRKEKRRQKEKAEPEKKTVREGVAVEKEARPIRTCFREKLIGRKIPERIAAVVLTCGIFYVCFSYITGILNQESAAGVMNLKYWEKSENAYTDILFLGASTMSCNIEIGELWKKYGIASYCLGAAGSTFYDDYYRLIEAEKSHHTDMVVVEVRAAVYSTEYPATMYSRENITGLNLSLNKLRYVNAAIEPEQRLNYLLTFPLYHGKYNSVIKWDFLHKTALGEDDKGTWEILCNRFCLPGFIYADDVIEYRAMNEKEEYYLRKIIEYCGMNDIQLLLLKTPDGNRILNQPYYNAVGVIAESCGVPYLDLNRFDKEIGLTDQDFHDSSGVHLNVIGARKCTVFLGNYLKENYDLTDHRGDERYESWNRFAANREDLCLRAIVDPDDYFEELALDDKRVIAISYRISEEKSEEYMNIKKNLEKGSYEFYDKKDVLYGKEHEMLLTLYNSKISIMKDYSACQIDIDGETTIEIDSPGIILIVYDGMIDKIADIAVFTSADNFALKHLYAGGED